jgi:hypothetical protein
MCTRLIWDGEKWLALVIMVNEACSLIQANVWCKTTYLFWRALIRGAIRLPVYLPIDVLRFPTAVDCVWNVMAHAQKPDFVFRRNGRVHLNGEERQFSRLLTAEVYASAVVMLDTPCSEVVWRVLATHSIRQFPLHSPSPRASPCAITFQLQSTTPVLRVCPFSKQQPAIRGHCKGKIHPVTYHADIPGESWGSSVYS